MTAEPDIMDLPGDLQRFIVDRTNPKVAGAEVHRSGERIMVHDYRAGHKRWILVAHARAMTLDEYVAYHGVPTAKDPCEQELVKRALEIQAMWSPVERERRKRIPNCRRNWSIGQGPFDDEDEEEEDDDTPLADDED